MSNMSRRDRPTRTTPSLRPRERGAIDLEALLMLGFVVGALVLTVLFVGGFADDIPTVAAESVPEQPLSPAARDEVSAPRGDIFDEFRRGVAAVLDSSSAAPAAPEPERSPAGLNLLAPLEGETLYGDSVTVRFVAGGVLLGESAENGEGTDLPIGMVRLILDEREPILLDRAQPYTFEGVAEGEHLLTVELVDERSAPLSPPVTEWVRFSSQNAPPPAFLPETGK